MGLVEGVSPSGAHQADEPPLVPSLAEADDHRFVETLLPHGGLGDGGDVGPVLAHIGGAEQQRSELLHAGPVLAGDVVFLEDTVDGGQQVSVGQLQYGAVPQNAGGDRVSPVVAQVRIGPGNVGDAGRGRHRLPLVVRMPEGKMASSMTTVWGPTRISRGSCSDLPAPTAEVGWAQIASKHAMDAVRSRSAVI